MQIREWCVISGPKKGEELFEKDYQKSDVLLP